MKPKTDGCYLADDCTPIKIYGRHNRFWKAWVGYDMLRGTTHLFNGAGYCRASGLYLTHEVPPDVFADSNGHICVVDLIAQAKIEGRNIRDAVVEWLKPKDEWSPA